MNIIVKYVKSVLSELGQIVMQWGDREWTIAFVCLIGIGYAFLKGSGSKKAI